MWEKKACAVSFVSCDESTYDWMVRGTLVSPAHQSSNPGACVYSWIYFRIFGDAHSVWGDVPVDDEAWLRKTQDDMPAQSFEGAHRDRMCMCAFIRMSVCACIRALVSVLMLKKLLFSHDEPANMHPKGHMYTGSQKKGVRHVASEIGTLREKTRTHLRHRWRTTCQNICKNAQSNTHG